MASTMASTLASTLASASSQVCLRAIDAHTRKRLLGPWKFLLRCNLYHHQDAESRVHSSLKKGGNCILSSLPSPPYLPLQWYTTSTCPFRCTAAWPPAWTHEHMTQMVVLNEWNIIDFYSQLFCPICPVRHNLITIILVIRTVETSQRVLCRWPVTL